MFSRAYSKGETALECMATPMHSTTKKMVSHTITALQRWSCGTRDLPGNMSTSIHKLQTEQTLAVSQIKALHIYDFDNTSEDTDF